MPKEVIPQSPKKPRRIAHLDMDAFFASVELLRYPQLKGLPVVIGGGRRGDDDLLARLRASEPEREDCPLHKIPLKYFPKLSEYVGRGVITTATYPARQFGIGSAMGLMKAAKLCPEAIILPVDFERYRHFSRLFKETILEIAPQMEDRGIDEVYIDFTDVPGGQREGGLTLARLIQKTILKITGLTCSIGVAPNKLLAKMASEFNKPYGISVIHENDFESLYWPLACRKVNGIGPKADAKLLSFGIHTIGELARYERSWLVQNFGNSYGVWLYDVARGMDDRPVVMESEPTSMSRETTFERNLHAAYDKEELGQILLNLCERLSADLIRKGYQGKTIGIKLRYSDFKSVTRDMTIETATDQSEIIRQMARRCLKRVDLSKPLRLLGVKMSHLVLKDEIVTSKIINNEISEHQIAIDFDS